MYKLFFVYIITFFCINLVNCRTYKYVNHTQSKTSDIFKETAICGPLSGQYSMCTNTNSPDFDGSGNPQKDDNN